VPEEREGYVPSRRENLGGQMGADEQGLLLNIGTEMRLLVLLLFI
jgi:hypothetical protein